MNRFLYGRLKERSKDYRFYIPPQKKIGLLFDAISSDFLTSERKFLFLQRFEGTITFGVRERLTFRDVTGAPICNFMGYQLGSEESPEAVPFFDAFSSRFSAILKEAHECHRLLDKDSEGGKNMQETQIVFERGHPRNDNGWDEAVTQIADGPPRDVLMMFDDTGKRLSMDVGYAQTKKTAPEERVKNKSFPPPRQHHDAADRSYKSERPASKRGPVSEEHSRSARGLGITSSVTLDSDERRTVRPLEDYSMKDSWLRKSKNKIRAFFKNDDDQTSPGPRSDM